MARRPSSLLVAACCVVLPSALACGGASTPQGAVDAYRVAIDGGDTDAAYHLLSEQAQRTTSRRRSDLDVQRRQDAGDAYVRELQRTVEQPAALSAKLAYSPYEAVELAYQNGEWRIVSGVADVDAQSTPAEALRMLVRALETRDAAAMLRLAPAEFRVHMGAADVEAWFASNDDLILAFLDRVGVVAHAAIVERGDVATLRYGARRVELRREGARWVVWDFQ